LVPIPNNGLALKGEEYSQMGVKDGVRDTWRISGIVDGVSSSKTGLENLWSSNEGGEMPISLETFLVFWRLAANETTFPVWRRLVVALRLSAAALRL
tara:strand:- start:32 stop:322 length:291 start_codon:yes stop_codon:yes gene_type:complete